MQLLRLFVWHSGAAALRQRRLCGTETGRHRKLHGCAEFSVQVSHPAKPAPATVTSKVLLRGGGKPATLRLSARMASIRGLVRINRGNEQRTHLRSEASECHDAPRGAIQPRQDRGSGADIGFSDTGSQADRVGELRHQIAPTRCPGTCAGDADCRGAARQPAPRLQYPRRDYQDVRHDGLCGEGSTQAGWIELDGNPQNLEVSCVTRGK